VYGRLDARGILTAGDPSYFSLMVYPRHNLTKPLANLTLLPGWNPDDEGNVGNAGPFLLRLCTVAAVDSLFNSCEFTLAVRVFFSRCRELFYPHWSRTTTCAFHLL